MHKDNRLYYSSPVAPSKQLYGGHYVNWNNILSPSKVWNAIQIETAALMTICRFGRPDVILHFLGGLGDELLLTCVAHELRRRFHQIKIWQISAAAELLRNNPDYSVILGRQHWPLRHSNLLERQRIRLEYQHGQPQLAATSNKTPREHILAILCRRAGISGKVTLRPWCFPSPEEAQKGRFAPRQIAIQSVGKQTHETWMKNKCWFHDRFQQVVEEIRRSWPDRIILQIGSKLDLPLKGVYDLRGGTSLREVAGLLSQCECFIGTEGFLSHLARAVNCRSVVIYGGRQHSWQLGYICNENLESYMPCAPCWLWQDCDFDRECMKRISVAEVVDALGRALTKQDMPLEVQEIDLTTWHEGS